MGARLRVFLTREQDQTLLTLRTADVSRWALKNTTRLRNVNRLKAYI